MKRALLYTAAVAALATGAALVFLPPKDEFKDLFCPALNTAEAYQKDDLDQFARLIPGRDGWVFRTSNDFRADYAVNEKTRASLLAMQKAFREKGIELVIAFPPVRGLVHADKLLPEYTAAVGMSDPAMAWANYEGEIKSLRDAGLNIVGIDHDEATPDFYYRQNHHWSANGARIMADKLAAYIKTLPAYKDVPEAAFATADGGVVAYDSSFKRAFKSICGTDIPPDNVHTFTTSAEGELFGDRPQAGIVLLGTSNSVQESSSANFEGFLKQALRADVYNMAFIGAGIDTSIISFLNSDLYKNGGVKIAVWEVPGYYDFNVMDDRLFAQVIPAVYGGCREHPVLARNFVDLTKGRTVLFDVRHDVMPVEDDADYYLKLDFSDPVKDPLSVRFYDDGDTDRQDFDRASRYPADSLFYTLVSDESPDKITLEVPESVAGMDVEAEVCKLP